MLIGKLTNSMAIFNSYVKLPDGLYVVVDLNSLLCNRQSYIYMYIYIDIYIYVYIYNILSCKKWIMYRFRNSQTNIFRVLGGSIGLDLVFPWFLWGQDSSKQFLTSKKC